MLKVKENAMCCILELKCFNLYVHPFLHCVHRFLIGFNRFVHGFLFFFPLCFLNFSMGFHRLFHVFIFFRLLLNPFGQFVYGVFSQGYLTCFHVFRNCSMVAYKLSMALIFFQWCSRFLMVFIDVCMVLGRRFSVLFRWCSSISRWFSSIS